jgi:hypothetical protein
LACNVSGRYGMFQESVTKRLVSFGRYNFTIAKIIVARFERGARARRNVSAIIPVMASFIIIFTFIFIRILVTLSRGAPQVFAKECPDKKKE